MEQESTDSINDNSDNNNITKIAKLSNDKSIDRSTDVNSLLKLLQNYFPCVISQLIQDYINRYCKSHNRRHYEPVCIKCANEKITEHLYEMSGQLIIHVCDNRQNYFVRGVDVADKEVIDACASILFTQCSKIRNFPQGMQLHPRGGMYRYYTEEYCDFLKNDEFGPIYITKPNYKVILNYGKKDFGYFRQTILQIEDIEDIIKS